MKDPNRLSGYKLKEGSPAIESGEIIQDNGEKDFGGISITGIPNIGAFENDNY